MNQPSDIDAERPGRTHTVGSLADVVRGEVVGDRERPIRGVADLRFAGGDRIGFLRDTKYAQLARDSGAGAILVREALELPAAQIVVADPFAAFARVALLFHPLPRAQRHRIDDRASVAASAHLQEPVDIGPGAVIEDDVEIGPGSVVGAGVVVGRGSRLGRDCVLRARVVLYSGVRLGDRVVVHAGAVLGSDGFGYAPDAGEWVKLPQVGHVEIGDDVEIGANCTVDCGTLGATRIGAGTKIDNLVHVAHNCVIGRHCAIAGFSALAGSVTLGDQVTLGGHVIVHGHLEIVSGARVGGASVVHTDITTAEDFMGYPLQPKLTWFRTLAALRSLAGLRAALRRLERAER